MVHLDCGRGTVPGAEEALMAAKVCTWTTKRTVGRNEFQSQTYNHTCGKPVESGLYCPKHNEKAAQEDRVARFKQEQRAARAARAERTSR